MNPFKKYFFEKFSSMHMSEIVLPFLLWNWYSFMLPGTLLNWVGELSVSFHGYNSLKNTRVICSVQVGWNPAAEPSGFCTLFKWEKCYQF